MNIVPPSVRAWALRAGLPVLGFVLILMVAIGWCTNDWELPLLLLMGLSSPGDLPPACSTSCVVVGYGVALVGYLVLPVLVGASAALVVERHAKELLPSLRDLELPGRAAGNSHEPDRGASRQADAREEE